MERTCFYLPDLSDPIEVFTLKAELTGEMGVRSVEANARTGVVVVEWAHPASADRIRRRLAELDFSPQLLALSNRDLRRQCGTPTHAERR